MIVKSNTFKTCFLLLFSIFIVHISFAQNRDSLKRDTTTETAAVNADTAAVKSGHLRTAGHAWKSVVFSVPGDFVQMGKTLTNDWRQTAAYTAGIALLILADKPVTQWYQDKVEKNVTYKLPKLPGSTSNRFFYGNDAYLNYSIIGLYGASLIANYNTGQQAALNSAKALTYSYLITQVALKAVFARQRPDPTLSDGKAPKKPFTDDPHDFFNFRRVSFNTGPNATSFPSMHATAYFAVARVMAMEFNNYWIPYGAVTLIFFADVDSHQHWVGDMVAGGLLGTVIGQGIVSSTRLLEKRQRDRKVSTRHRPFNFNYQVLPAVSSRMMGLTLFAQL